MPDPALQACFIGMSLILAGLGGRPIATGLSYPLIAVLALAMGIQNAMARKLAVPDLTTTVLTLTITGTAADSAIAGGKGSAVGRGLVAVTAMALGALIGATFVIHVGIVYPLVLALLIIVAVAAVTRLLRRADSPWVRA